MKRFWVYEWAAVLSRTFTLKQSKTMWIPSKKERKIWKLYNGAIKNQTQVRVIIIKIMKTLLSVMGEKGNTLNKAEIRSDRSFFSFIQSLSFTGMGFLPLKSNLSPLIFLNLLQKLWLPTTIFNFFCLVNALRCHCLGCCWFVCLRQIVSLYDA